MWPESPDFESEAERQVFNALRKDLRDGDALLHGLRFSDRKQGDIEIDITVFLEGAGVAVIEVKGGKVSYRDGKWISQSALGQRHNIHPTDQARKCRYALREFLTRSPRWSRGTLRDAWMVAMPGTEVPGDMAPDAPRHLILGRDNLDDALGRVFDVLNDEGNVNRLSGAGWIEVSLDLLLNRGEPLRDIIADAAERAEHIDRLTREQGQVLDLFCENQRIEVHGGAGSGKTWLAFEQARRWSAEGQRVALLSFGRGLATSLAAQCAGLKRQHQPAFVGTFHKLGYDWGVIPEPDAPSDWWNETAPKLMRDAAQQLPPGQRFDALVVDEAQDFADDWWDPLLAALKDRETARIATFRDDNQAVFGRRGHPDLSFAQVSLTTNLRNTNEIGSLFGALIKQKSRLLGGQGPPVRFVPCATDDAVGVASDEAVALLDAGWDARDVALLTTLHRHPMQVEQQADGQGSYWSNLWTGEDVFYGTVSGFKGLERPAIVLAIDGFRGTQDARELLYVGMSRARDQLVVVGDPELIRGVAGDQLLHLLGA